MKEVTCKFCKHTRNVPTGEEILTFRKRNKLTLKGMAEVLKLSVSFISDCEKSRRNLSSESAHRMQMYDLRHWVFKKGTK